MKKIVLYPIYIATLLALLYFDKVLSLILSAINYACAPIKCSGILLLGFGIAIIILIESLRYKRDTNKPYRKPQVTETFPLYNDQPNNDDTYGRDSSARLLISKIFSTFNAEKDKGSEGSLVININEAYGYGKTTFLKILEHELQSSHAGEYYLINYRPWLCDSEKAIIRELFTLLRNSIGIAGIRDDIQDYLYMLLLQSEQITPSEIKPFYVLMPRKLKSKTLQELHDDIKDKLKEIEHPIIITIDDVDRLHEKELVAVLKLIRDTADFPNIFYILAADDAHLEVMLKRQGIEQPHLFLQKFFNLDYLLPAHENVPTQALKNEMERVLKIYGYSPKDVSSSINRLSHLLYLSKVFTNMRVVYRFLNIYTSSLDLLKSNNNIKLIDPYELFCLTIIRYLSTKTYKILRERNDEFLEVDSNHLDARYRLKKEINLEYIKRQEEMDFHFEEQQYKNDPQNNEKPQRPKPKSEGLTIESAIQQTDVTSDQIAFFLLDHLFGSTTYLDEHSICRCNTYFIYFSGKVESDKLTTAQTIDILKMNVNDYEKQMEILFVEGKGTAFMSNFDYAYKKSDISREYAMKKAYIYLEKKYYHTEDIHHEIFETFENYINSDTQPFMNFLYGLYGNNHNPNIERHLRDVEKQLEEFCMKEDNIHMLVLAFYEFSRRLSDFCFGRQFISKMLGVLADRIITERMEGKTYSQVKEPTYDTIYLLRDEFSTKDQWMSKFEAFLCKDASYMKQWLGSTIRFYSDGRFDWNNRHRNAIIGEGFNSSEAMLDSLKQKHPDFSETIEDLKHLQHYTSLREQESMGSTFIQMARDVQDNS
ncbi:MAG: hypothetical protein J5797_11305 [Prevotella sp.]|nr:hypothetical protein [Prevotella sp.]